MDKRHFDQLVKGVREMKLHVSGKAVRGARVTELAEPDVRAIREAAKISQSQFAKLIGEVDGRPHVEVAYGTSQNADRPHSGECQISPPDGEAYALAGLSYPTKFDLRNRKELPYSEDWFRVTSYAPHGQTPKLGVLHPSLMRRARAAFDAAR
jgi:hypothetical protein